MAKEKLYTWISDFSQKKNTILLNESLITEAEKLAFQNKIDNYCSGKCGALSNPTDHEITLGSKCTSDTPDYTVCGCGDDTANPAIGSQGIKYCTRN